MKKTRIQAIVFVASLLVLGGCSNLLLEKPRESVGPKPALSDIPEGFGTVQVSLTRGAERTVAPDPVELDTLHLEYWFAKDGGSAEKKNPEGDGIFILEAGTYTLTVNGLLTADDPASLAAQGATDAPFAIVAGTETETVNVALHPVTTGEGTGTLKFDLQYPSVGVTVESLTLTRIVGNEFFDLMDPVPAVSNTNPRILTGTKSNIPVGYYLLRAVLRNNAGAVVGKSEAVHIYQNLTAETALAGYIFTAADFNAYIVRNNNDSGPGSLRQALMDAPAGQTIQVMLEPGSIISLAGALPSISKSITIAGNGITLTRSASWTTSNTASQLLSISSSTAVVKISRVYFKNGLATNYGGAIRNAGTLTLESCIFSGNQTTETYAYGGAIYSTNTLTIKGSTFYRNTSDYHGGAVYFYASGKTLTLTGNVFYGNTAPSRPVAYYSGSVNASYNVVDTDFGTETTHCGWAQGTGDVYSTALFLSGKTFKLFSGSKAGGVITPPDYPSSDFYGAPIEANAAAGAVQTDTTGSGYYLELSVNNYRAGTVEVSPPPDEDGLVSGPFTLTPNQKPEYTFGYWLVNGVQTINAPTGLSDHTVVQAVFNRAVTVNSFTDGADSATTPGTLRYVLANVQDGDVISFSGVNAGTTTIELESALPVITKNIAIEGNGITLTRSASWITSSETSQLLYISSSTAVVKISRVYFKNGLATSYGGAIRNAGTLTLESCIFSDNRTTSNGYLYSGGAIYSANTLTIKGSTFYRNTAGYYGGAVYFNAPGKTLTLTGNLFYRNTALSRPVVYIYSGSVNASYNVVDTDFGTGSSQCGWEQGTEDVYSTAPLLSPKTFRFLPENGAANIITSPPLDYPTVDFYGQPISAYAAAGAAQSATGSGYYLELSVNNYRAGTVEVSPPPDEDGLVSGPFTLTPNQKPGYTFGYWLVNGVQTINAPTGLSDHTVVQAVFNRAVTVNSFTDGADSATTPGTLRYVLANVQDGDVISFSGVNAGTTTIKLESALPEITKNIAIEGNGITLTRSASWTTSSNTSQLLYISSSTAVVKISRVYFKNGLATDYGGAIRNAGPLTLESCIFNGNQTTASNAGGGVIDSSGNLTIRGCTFYSNNTLNTSSSYGGGVVYFSGSTLTLIGNLFYENTAQYYPVARIGIGSGSVNASYNAVDVAFGMGSSQCGWTQGPGDTTLTALGVSGVPFDTTTFVPVTGLLNVLPSSSPANFPATDFYGITRTFPGTLGAVKLDVVDYTVTFNANGGIPSPAVQTIVSGGKVTEPAVPAKTGFIFGGWHKEAGLTTPWNFPTDTVTEGITLYAKWTLDSYAITYNLDGGTNNAANPPAYTVVDLPITLATPAFIGHTFHGWYDNGGFTGSPVTSILAGSTGNRTFYAKWTLDSYAITYNLNGGTNNAANLAAYTADDLPITLAAPTRSGYTFHGWYDNGGFTGGPVTSILAGSTGAKTFYAKWAQSVSVNVSVWVNEDDGNILASNNDFTISKSGSPPSFTATVENAYAGIQWRLQSIPILGSRGTAQSITFNAVNSSNGTYILGVTVTKNEIPYSTDIHFTVTN